MGNGEGYRRDARQVGIVAVALAGTQSFTCGTVGTGQIAVAASARVFGTLEALPTSCLDDRSAGIQGCSANL